MIKKKDIFIMGIINSFRNEGHERLFITALKKILEDRGISEV
jgi:hypothetical protein